MGKHQAAPKLIQGGVLEAHHLLRLIEIIKHMPPGGNLLVVPLPFRFWYSNLAADSFHCGKPIQSFAAFIAFFTELENPKAIFSISSSGKPHDLAIDFL
jgi:hypothetical protein